MGHILLFGRGRNMGSTEDGECAFGFIEFDLDNRFRDIASPQVIGVPRNEFKKAVSFSHALQMVDNALARGDCENIA